MEEIWKDIPGFSGYQVSNTGYVRTFRMKIHYPTGYGCYWIIGDIPTIMSASDDGNGYLKVMLYGDDGHRYCKKVHRLVAEAFIYNDDPINKDTVDHINSGPEGKLDNSVNNLRWISRRENVQKAYNDGMYDERIHISKKEIILYDTFSGEDLYFESVQDAACFLQVHYTTIIHAINDNKMIHQRYTADYLYYCDLDDVLSFRGDNYGELY